MLHTTYLGFPRMGRRRELKKALEAYWQGELSGEELRACGSALRHRHWLEAKRRGISSVPVNDFSLYDQVLDTAMLFDAIPERYRALHERDPLAGYFAMARGNANLPALEMTKWFDTNYHYLVPELEPGQHFRLRSAAPLSYWHEAQALGLEGRPVLLGPVSFLKLAKTLDGGDPLALLEALLPAYRELLGKLQAAGVAWVQLDEPCLVSDLDANTEAAYRRAYAALAEGPHPKLLLASYFGALDSALPLAVSLPLAGLHVDLSRQPEQLQALLAAFPADWCLSLGLIDGRSIWRSAPERLRPWFEQAYRQLGPARLWLAPSCSLLHLPLEAAAETSLAPELRSWLAFALEKLEEVQLYARSLENDQDAQAQLDKQQQQLQARAGTPGVHRPEVRQRLAALQVQSDRRRSGLAHRLAKQEQELGLPLLPTTTIGSFPQTPELRRARAEHRAGRLDEQAYQAVLEAEVGKVIRFQESIGLDVLVHGEPERNDMVEFFGEQLEGYAFTRHGWVQSYGSRCVKPPIIWGDIARPAPMTTRWSRYAQSLTDKPVKGMLTGPVTMLQWSFVRDDLSRQAVCLQLARVLRDEVADLEAAGIRVIQIDEPALREGLPLRRAEQAAYLAWAVHSFRIACGGCKDSTQIHTHMCYSEFNEIIEAVAALDADVISIESSRSRMELLEAFERFDYPGAIGPGVYDIHSPRIPPREEMAELLTHALKVLPPKQLWVNPDCGLKTRRWEEVQPALEQMVAAARELRARLADDVNAPTPLDSSGIST